MTTKDARAVVAVSEDQEWLAVRGRRDWSLWRAEDDGEYWNWCIQERDTGQQAEEALEALVKEYHARYG